MKKPVVELSDCVKCEICINLCPEVFKMNDAGFVEVEELDEYPIEEIEEAVKNCPADCIFFEDD